MKVAYLGPEGTFSEEAAFRFFRGQSVEWADCTSIPDVLEVVSREEASYGIVPIENSIDGSVNVALDGLLTHDELFVCGESILPIEQTLLGLHGATLEGIREVWSVPPALAQCHEFIRQHHLKQVHFTSTAAAAQEVKASGRTDVAAIASSWAAQKFGLSILSTGIQDAKTNYTRFVTVVKNEEVPENADKTMLLVLPNSEHSGVLASILNVFATFGLNLSWIVSRPAKTQLGVYLFIFDVEAGVQDVRMQKSLTILRTFDHHVRVVGSFVKA